MRNGMHGECDPVLDSNLAHQACCGGNLGLAFAFSENRTKRISVIPQVENAIVRRRLQFLAAVIDGKGQHDSERIGQEEEIYHSVHPAVPRASESYAGRERLA